MSRLIRLNLIFAFILLIVASSCTAKSCSVKLNKKKFKYYNSLQFGGGRKR